MTTRLDFVVPALLAFVAGGISHLRAAEPVIDGVAVAIVMDTSGSMNEPVMDEGGKKTPKAVIAKRARSAVLTQFSGYLSRGTPDHPRRVDLALYTFNSGGVKQVRALQTFNPEQQAQLVHAIPAPGGGTPLGNSMKAASSAVLASKLPHKHILVITDGANTVGPTPSEVLPGIYNMAKAQQDVVSFHFVAFDISASIFSPIKAMGVNVVSAADEVQLNTQLGLILEKKILLEDEEVPEPKPAAK